MHETQRIVNPKVMQTARNLTRKQNQLIPQQLNGGFVPNLRNGAGIIGPAIGLRTVANKLP